MPRRIIRGIGYLVLGSTIFVALSWTQGQEKPGERGRVSAPSARGPDATPLAKLPPLQQQMYLSAQRGTDWLFRMNGTDGRFVNGLVPSLKTPLEGDHYLRQAGATIALARAARFLGEERYAARARQAVLTLLADTALETLPSGERREANVPARATTLPPPLVNRLAAAGLLVQAICELPAPADDLREQAEQLAAFIRSQQQADGSLRYHEATDGSAGAAGVDATNHYPGPALYGLMLSQRLRPAPWKVELVRKALPYYRAWWRAHRNMAFLSSQSAAYAEAYLLTQEKPFADAVYEMNDWLCELQYPLLDPRHATWGGGFMGWEGGRPATIAPQVGSAVYAESLAAACRVARKLGDLPRYQRYREALERCLQFLTRLQYTDANTQHFADWYRPYLVGAFYASLQDGNIRIDYTQHAVLALVQYLELGTD